MDDVTWRDQAKCKFEEPDLWFPIAGQDASYAKFVCASCPVSALCLKSAIDNQVKSGIWGGVEMGPRETIHTRFF